MLLGVSQLIASSSRRLTSEQVSERETAFKLVTSVHTYVQQLLQHYARGIPSMLSRSRDICCRWCDARHLRHMFFAPAKSSKANPAFGIEQRPSKSNMQPLDCALDLDTRYRYCYRRNRLRYVCRACRATRRTCREENAFALPYMVRKRGRSFRIH